MIRRRIGREIDRVGHNRMKGMVKMIVQEMKKRANEEGSTKISENLSETKKKCWRRIYEIRKEESYKYL